MKTSIRKSKAGTDLLFCQLIIQVYTHLSKTQKRNDDENNNHTWPWTTSSTFYCLFVRYSLRWEKNLKLKVRNNKTEVYQEYICVPTTKSKTWRALGTPESLDTQLPPLMPRAFLHFSFYQVEHAYHSCPDIYITNHIMTYMMLLFPKSCSRIHVFELMLPKSWRCRLPFITSSKLRSLFAFFFITPFANLFEISSKLGVKG